MFEWLIKKIKRCHPYILNIAGSIFLSASLTYIRGYKFSSNFIETDLSLSFWFFEHIFCNPYLGTLLGIILMITAIFSNHFREKDSKFEIDQKHNEDINKLMKKNKENIDKLMTENQELKEAIYNLHRKNVDNWIKGMYKVFDFTPKERLSIYFYYRNRFILLARHSSDPEKKETHNPTHPIETGILGKIWRNGQFTDMKCPVYDEEDDKSYLEHMEKCYGYSSERTKEMNMKSCRYFGMSITDSDDNIGIILFESTEEGSLSEEDRNLMVSYWRSFDSYLCNFIKDSIVYEEQKQRNSEINSSPEQEFISDFNGEKHE